MGREVVHDAVEDRAPALVGHRVVRRPRRARGPGAADRERIDQVEERLYAAGDHGFVECLLALEVVVEAGGGQAGLAGDVADGGARQAALREESLGDVEDPLAGRLALGDLGLAQSPTRPRRIDRPDMPSTPRSTRPRGARSRREPTADRGACLAKRPTPVGAEPDDGRLREARWGNERPGIAYSRGRTGPSL